MLLNNASVYDPYWSVQPIVIIIGLVLSYGLTLYTILLLISVCYWGIRLTANWAYTFRNLKAQDWRYTLLKEKTGIFYPLINFIGIHMIPTLVVFLCVLPVVVVIVDGIKGSYISYLLLLLSLAAATIQLFADIQMQKFRKNRTGNFIRNGLWKNARHPNYFGEILMWWGIGLSVISAVPSNYYLIIGAIVNTLLFCCVSIPMAERKQSAKDGFEEYKKQTRLLI